MNPIVKVTNEDETESQTVTLPYTLNAIPVSSGGNVTFTDKQTAIKLVQDTYVIYALSTPTEEDLSLEQIKSIKSLSTYYPVTIVENNYNTWMKATYKSTESV